MQGFHLGWALVGLGLVATGAVGITLPRGERLTSLLALVVGGGVGIVALAIGFEVGSSRTMDGEGHLFLLASALGLTATVLTLVFLRRAGRGAPDPDMSSAKPPSLPRLSAPSSNRPEPGMRTG